MPLSFNAFADVTLELPKNIRLLVVNEQSVDGGLLGFFVPSDDTLKLKNGENQIVFNIDEYFYRGGKQSDRAYSNAVIMTFTADNQKNKIKFT
ncbi:DUF2057 family protein [Photobacterium leiognathi]|uniref:DUF2057 family protein n=1 Tax=Photobacterium leiognathi TaxID=553611 RepID=UPI0027343815|nr:DUF2057 family protein [Photobacterium leiognathi]